MISDTKKSKWLPWYVVSILTLANLSSFIDRQILSLLVKPIKRDLHLSDTQISLLMGLSFALFYTLFGVIIARLADTKNRRNIIILGITAWSLMTSLCAGVKSYIQFFLARMGVGVGESTLSPSAYSMIADIFPREKLARATSTFTLGIFVGSGLAMLIGSMIIAKMPVEGLIHLPLLGDVFPWQMIFIYIGIPGLLISILLFTIIEPKRKNLKANFENVSFIETLKIIFKYRSAFICICMASSFQAFVSYGTTAWVPTFISRTYGWPVPQAGMYFGLILMTASICGALFGGWFSDALIKKGILHGRIHINIISGILCLLFCFFTLLPQAELSLLFLFIPAFALAAPFGAATAAVQELMPNQVRAQATAILLFILNLIGMGMGPTFVALITDYILKDENAIRYSLLTLYITGGTLMILFSYLALKPYKHALQQIEKHGH